MYPLACSCVFNMMYAFVLVVVSHRSSASFIIIFFLSIYFFNRLSFSPLVSACSPHACYHRTLIIGSRLPPTITPTRQHTTVPPLLFPIIICCLQTPKISAVFPYPHSHIFITPQSLVVTTSSSSNLDLLFLVDGSGHPA